MSPDNRVPKEIPRRAGPEYRQYGYGWDNGPL